MLTVLLLALVKALGLLAALVGVVLVDEALSDWRWGEKARALVTWFLVVLTLLFAAFFLSVDAETLREVLRRCL